MKCVMLSRADLILSPELSRSRGSKQFEERLRASIEAVGLAEPIKVAALTDGKYLVVDGIMRLRAIDAIRRDDPASFSKIPAYVFAFDHRYELRFQTDIYQDLLPSQLAALMEHLHKTESVRKVDIARYIGVSPTTVRNYTGLWRLLQRGGLFARLVQLMDLGVLPASNPFAWLRLSSLGVREVIQGSFSEGTWAETWIEERVAMARRGNVAPFPIRFVESATDGLPPDCYREDEEVRTLKRNLGLRRASPASSQVPHYTIAAVRHLKRVSARSHDPVLVTAAQSLSRYLE
jgi:hypothetical protein